MYSVLAYGTMIQPGPRVDAYVAALRHFIRPGSTVMDLGSGPGFLAVMACRLGAAKVYAVEPDASIAVAKEIAAASFCADRIEFINDRSQNVSLPGGADVIVSDLRGVLPLFQNHIPSVIDARERLLAPEGTLIPARDTLWAAPVEDAQTYKAYDEPWSQQDGVDLRPGRRLAVNTWRKFKAEPRQLLGEPVRWAELDYRTVVASNLSGSARWTLTRSGTCHGFALWFDADLGGGASFSNAPGNPELVYGQAFFPLAEPAPLSPGDTLEVDLDAHLIGDDYTWSWKTRLKDPLGLERARHEQSSFNATPLTPDALRKREMSFHPRLDDEGVLVAAALTRMDGGASVEEIARDLMRSHSRRFKNLSEVQRFVGKLAAKYSR